MPKKWIQRALKGHGSVHKQLGIPKDKKIPVSLLNKIIKAEPGDVIKNPTKVGKRRIKVTRLLEKRANLAKNLKNIKR